MKKIIYILYFIVLTFFVFTSSAMDLYFYYSYGLEYTTYFKNLKNEDYIYPILNAIPSIIQIYFFYLFFIKKIDYKIFIFTIEIIKFLVHVYLLLMILSEPLF